MIVIWVNHYGWILGGNAEKGLRFTRQRAGAKPFEPYSKDYIETMRYVEGVMQCNWCAYRRRI